MWRRLIPRARPPAEEPRPSPWADWLVIALVVATLLGVVLVFTVDPRGAFDLPRQIEYPSPPPPTPTRPPQP